ncbi:aminoacyl-histidine dipeptidase [Clostridium sp. MT-14]|uniref:aminoacyl-histidine dipeptidase n=1 Tax=unclassified Clostridium TaxID=2614128 RepID=UPI00123B2455|nr:aminoacyl-histidine dipeptidase [Clostridium sp. HV4-5-A1G]KAA8675210.1 aminoacyl-histidine dipeptidase [Clostridium sp. HV4-5-A1G]CAB1242158.1 Aminoacyl-histidine dipeptidase (Peptidase D) [Clostridiaceae bacterium BL-3]
MGDRILENVEPVEVFRYFEEISNIPRGSGNEREISDYLVSFAKKHNLYVIQDEALNVVVKKPGSRGYENSPGVIIQGHMDMVCEKKSGIEHDFMKDPIKLKVADDMLYAAGTTLGGDDGIAVAMGLAVLASENIDHPPIELVVTTSEETGMDGALALDPKNVSGKTLINIDSEEEGILLVSCAGGCSARTSIPIAWKNIDKNFVPYVLEIEGLKGGHSGSEIHKGRANSNKLLARLLKSLSSKINFNMSSIEGGSKHNAIAREAKAVICVNKRDESLLKEEVSNLEKIFKAEFKTADPDLKVNLKAAEEIPKRVMSAETSENIVNFLYLIPNGVQSMSMDIEGLVESSLNLGVVQTKENGVEAISSIRSSVGSIKENILNTIIATADLNNGKVTVEAAYPEWKYNPDSKIREVFIDVYERLFGKKPLVTAIHAGLECALFEEKFNGQLDMISFGPTMFGVHTADEHLSIPSTQRTWKYLVQVLKSLK